MTEQDLTPANQMQELLDRMAAMRAELDSLKHKTRGSSQPAQRFQPAGNSSLTITSTRRKTLKRLGLALLGGAATAGVLGVSGSVQAKVIANPQNNGMANKVGMFVLPPGAPDPINNLISNVTFGLVATSYKAIAFNLSILNTTGPIGVYGNSTGTGVYGEGDNTGVHGNSASTGVYGFGTKIGVQGQGQLAGLFVGNTGGGLGSLPATSTVGVVGSVGTNLDLSMIPANSTIGVYGVAPTGGSNYAGYFKGDVFVNGTLSKSGGTFKIDHPLDPANKYLYHSFVESPDMKNIYDGITTLDELGEAVVEMPDWFEALNSDFRYQLTSIGVSMPDLFIVEKLANRRFKIAGGKSGQEVSWMVTGIRQDAYAKAYRSPVEEDKPADDTGTYLHPELFNLSSNQLSNQPSEEAQEKSEDFQPEAVLTK